MKKDKPRYRIIYDGSFYKIQELVEFLWFKYYEDADDIVEEIGPAATDIFHPINFFGDKHCAEDFVKRIIQYRKEKENKKPKIKGWIVVEEYN